jgi:hypothetical protein
MNIEALIAKLQQQDAALGDGGNVLNTANAQTAFWTQKVNVAKTVSGLMNAPNDLAKPVRLLTECEARRAAVVAKQEEIQQQLADAPDLTTIRDGRERDKEYDRQQMLRRQLQMLHDGTLLLAQGVASERLSDLDARIAELTQRRDRAQWALDAHVKAAEQLLGEPVST